MITLENVSRDDGERDVRLLGNRSLLKGFNISYGSDDHHIKTIRAATIPTGGKLRAHFYDKHSDTASGRAGIVAFDKQRPFKPCTLYDSERLFGLEQYFNCLSGFNISYSSDDHHIQTLSVQTNRIAQTCMFQDKQSNKALGSADILIAYSEL